MCHFFYDDSQIPLSDGETVPRCPGTSMETSSSSAMRGELWTSWDERRTGEKWRTKKKPGRKWYVHGKNYGLLIFMEKAMEFDGLLSDFPWNFPWIFIGSSDFSMDDGGYSWILMGAVQEPLRKLPQTPGGETGRLGGDHRPRRKVVRSFWNRTEMVDNAG